MTEKSKMSVWILAAVLVGILAGFIAFIGMPRDRAAEAAVKQEAPRQNTGKPYTGKDGAVYEERVRYETYEVKYPYFWNCYPIGVVCLIGAILFLWCARWIGGALPSIIKRRTQAVLQIFEAKNWYNARRRTFCTFQNDPYMRFFRGVCALEGLGGCSKDISKARTLFRKAANQGMLEAFCALGYMSQHGLGCEVNMTEARGYYSEAKNLGCSLAARLLDGLPSGT